LAAVVSTIVHRVASCQGPQTTGATQLWDSSWYHQWYAESQAGT